MTRIGGNRVPASLPRQASVAAAPAAANVAAA
jgi:hypothetical protein